MFTKKKIISLAVLGLALLPLAAFADVVPKHLSLEIRRFVDGLSRIGIPNTTEVTVGTNGVVAAPSSAHDAGFVSDAGLSPTDASIGLDAQAYDAASHTVTAATISAVPVPSALEVVLIDGSSNDTLTCDSVRIDGYDAWGFKTGETVTSVSESAKYTNTAFAEVTSVVGSGCTTGTNSAADALRVGASLKVALPVKIRQPGDIEAICIDDASGDLNCFTGLQVDTYDALEMDYFTVDLGDDDIDTAVGTSVASGDGLYIRVRPSPARP